LIGNNDEPAGLRVDLLKHAFHAAWPIRSRARSRSGSSRSRNRSRRACLANAGLRRIDRTPEERDALGANDVATACGATNLHTVPHSYVVEAARSDKDLRRAVDRPA